MTVAHPYALPEVAQVPLIVDDGFHSQPEVLAISLAARGLWVSAGTWSSDHGTGGRVPDHVAAALGGSPQLCDELLEAGLWRRVRRGVQFNDWEKLNDTAEQAERKKADAERKRAQATERQRRHRAAKAAGDVTQPSRSTSRDVTHAEYITRNKPQLRGSPVTRDKDVTSRVTPPSDDLDLDLDFHQSSQPDQINRSSRRNARAKPPDDELIPIAVDAVCQREGRTIDPAEARGLIAVIAARARKSEEAGKPVRNWEKYIRTSVANEADLYTELLPAIPPLEVILSEPLTDPRDAERHPYEPGPQKLVDQCARPGCGLRRTNWRHEEAKTA